MEQYDNLLTKCPYCGTSENIQNSESMHIPMGVKLQDRYIVGAALGDGSFGITYIGWDTLLEHKVAIKEYMPNEFSTRALGERHVTIFQGKKAEQFVSGKLKFYDEAKRLAKLNSINGIVHVYDAFEENDTAYIIMELLEGETLSAYLEREKTLPYDQAVSMLLPLLTALQEVHKIGIIHRDIAPDNIFLTKEGEVKLIDFGAARFATTGYSRSLTVLIKPGYSPEEQYRSNGEQGTFTDVYAVGAVLYKMLTGKMPPDALERRAFFENKKKDMLMPIPSYVKDVPENIQNAIYNAMNIRIQDRTQTVGDLIAELTSAQPVKRKNDKIRFTTRRIPLWQKIVFSSAAVLLGVTAFLMLRPQTDVVEEYDSDVVPSVIGLDLETAAKRLNEAGEDSENHWKVSYIISGKEFSEDQAMVIPVNLVLRQTPLAGTKIENDVQVKLTVSGGLEMVKMPNLVGTSLKQAQQQMDELKLLVTTSTKESQSVPKGVIISQDIEPELECAIGSKVHLIVSEGSSEPEQIELEVPDMVGKRYEDIRNGNPQLQLEVKEQVYNDTAENGVILTQSIPADTKIQGDQKIELTVSKGRPVVPDVMYKPEAEAIALLKQNSLGYQVKYELNDTVEKGLVFVQSVAAGEQSNINSVILLTVCGEPPTTAPPTEPPTTDDGKMVVPDVIGMTEREAMDTLLNAGLASRTTWVSGGTDKVLTQSIPAGTRVDFGTTVYLEVAKYDD
jgi:serine/threonine protein kinase